jgi:exopolysaccharide production protein ExoY
MATTYRLLTFGTTRARSRLVAVYRVEPMVSALLLVVLAPLLVVLAGAIAILSRRSPLIRHTRVGFNGASLQMLKFRTMWGHSFEMNSDAESPMPPRDKRLPDPRITSAFAAWCRRYSLDELPQLVHVVRGEMSLVGPRPMTAAEVSETYGIHAAEVLSLRPGLSGLWQVMGRNLIGGRMRCRLDLFFARKSSPALYFMILWRSIPAVLRGTGAY